jgi:hypothetical protein
MEADSSRISQGFGGEPTGSEESDTKQGLEDHAQRVAEQARSVAERGKQKVVERAQGVSEALRHASEGLRADDQSELAGYTTSVADKLEQLTSALKDRDLATVVTDVTRFAKRQPALFLGGAFSAGLLAARFLKSSSQRAPESHARRGGGSSIDQEVLQNETMPEGFGPAPGGYGPASAPAGAHGGAGIFGAEGLGGGPGNDPALSQDRKGAAE